MTTALDTVGLGKRYGRRWALTDCTLAIPTGKVVGLVGPNGAGKSTLLHLAVGLLKPTSGTVSVLGARPGSSPAELTRIAFLAQDSPAYARLTVAEHLLMGKWLNPTWDAAFATSRVDELGLDLGQRAGTFVGRPTRPVGLDGGGCETPGTLGSGRARCSARPARPPRVLRAADGGCRGPQRQRRAVVPPHR